MQDAQVYVGASTRIESSKLPKGNASCCGISRGESTYPELIRLVDFVCLQMSGRTLDAMNPAHDNDGRKAPPGDGSPLEKESVMSGIDLAITRKLAIKFIDRPGG